jgi:hypothetical protein
VEDYLLQRRGINKTDFWKQTVFKYAAVESGKYQYQHLMVYRNCLALIERYSGSASEGLQNFAGFIHAHGSTSFSWTRFYWWGPLLLLVCSTVCIVLAFIFHHFELYSRHTGWML